MVLVVSASTLASAFDGAGLTLVTQRVTIIPVISSFRDRDTEGLFHREPVRKWSPAVLKAGLRKLRMLDAATTLEAQVSAGESLGEAERQSCRPMEYPGQ